ncbi:18519_t:CDS:1 [Funneliformis geosporum]|uniref:11850_t:CDS:1 n=1 Tax=Funneliformis geosporum TaxID=1117311 RepID=A0A9W4SRV7_9GLOM|nr:18519_t:CDS:1 [Funneliformis geosporum]CAI2179158.1 11850_t:CDS:1 [Funneliformis geosporum]
MVQLPADCIQEILKFLDNNLFSCLLINRRWCRNTVPLIWNNPFRFEGLSDKKNLRFLDNYLKSLNQEENDWLEQKGIVLGHEQPILFDYASFLEVIKFDKLDLTIKNWVDYFYFDFKVPKMIFLEKGEYYINILAVLFKLFMRQSKSIRSLFISEIMSLPTVTRIKFPDCSTFSLAVPGIKEVKDVNFNFSYKVNPYKKIFEVISTTCTQIQNLSLSFPYNVRLKNLPHFNNSLINMIKNQTKLESITLKFIMFNLIELKSVFSSLNLHINWIRKIELNYFEINLMDFSLIFSKKSNNQPIELSLLDCVLYLYVENHEQIYEFEEIKLPVDSLKILFENDHSLIYQPILLQIVGENLRNLSLNKLDEDTIRYILGYCTNITSLEIVDLQRMDLSDILMIIKELQISKLKLSFNDTGLPLPESIVSDFLLNLSFNLPTTLTSLVLGNLQKFWYLQNFLENFEAPKLREIILLQVPMNFLTFIDSFKNFDHYLELLIVRNIHLFGIEFEGMIGKYELDQVKQHVAKNEFTCKLKFVKKVNGNVGFYIGGKLNFYDTFITT